MGSTFGKIMGYGSAIASIGCGVMGILSTHHYEKLLATDIAELREKTDDLQAQLNGSSDADADETLEPI